MVLGNESYHFYCNPNHNTNNNSYNCLYAYLYAFIHALGGFYFGFTLICMNSLGESIFKESMQITDEIEYEQRQSDSCTYYNIGQMVSSLICGILVNKFGRRNLVILIEILNVGSTCQMIFAPSPIIFIVGRAILGLYLGCVTVLSPRMVSECFPLSKRGITTGQFAILIATGQFMTLSMGKVLSKNVLDNYWQYIFLVPAAQSFLRMIVIVVFYNHKTPTQYILDLKKNNGKDYTKIEGAIDKVLLRYYDNLEDVKAYHKNSSNELLKEDQCVGMVQDIKESICSRATRYSTLAAIFLPMINQFSGQAFLDCYSVLVFDRIFYKGYGFEINFYNGFVVLFGAIVCVFLLNFWGRKFTFLLGAYQQLVFIWGITFCFYFKYGTQAVVCSACYYFACNQSICVLYVYLNEICEPFVSGISISGLWLTRTIVNIYLPYTFNWQQIYWCPATQVITSTIMFVLIRPLYIESKGKTREQMKKEYKEHKYNLFGS